MQPSFLWNDSESGCYFSKIMPRGHTFNSSDFILGDLRKVENRDVGDIAVERNGIWSIESASIESGIDFVTFYCEKVVVVDRMAYPIDPKMTEKDINGATIIEPNASNDGWVFAHASKAEHIDRVWLASTAMSSVFDRVMEDKLQQTLASIINNPQTNQQRGVYLNWAEMLGFKKDCTAYCVRFEKLLYLGQHKQQAGLGLRDMLLLCIKHVKAEWQKTEGKFDDVSGDVNGIISALEADHNWETRWEQEARHKAEEAKRKAAESETSDQQ